MKSKQTCHPFRRMVFIMGLMAIGIFTTTTPLNAQTLTDAIMMKKGEICFGLVYENSQFDHYWEGTLLRTNGTIETVTRKTILPMAAIGLINGVNLIVSLPYVQTYSSEPNGGKFAGASGFQDLGIALKATMIDHTYAKGKLSVLFTGGYSTPFTNYLSDYRPYSIGFGADEISGRAIAEYKNNNEFFGRLSLGYLHRGLTRAERDYYYNDGSYFTDLMNVPSAWNYNLVVGKWLFDSTLRLEADYTGLVSTSGDDIRPYNAPQPTNKVNFGQAGIFAQYYFPNIQGMGILMGFTQRLNGRNTGKIRAFRFGLTYQFG